jgi:pimeloyl-ACP methyl ester carboxylesterase
MKASLWRKARQGAFVLLLVGLFSQASPPPAAQAATPSLPAIPNTGVPYNTGDVFVAAGFNFGDPIFQVQPSTGAVLDTLNPTNSQVSQGICFDGLGNLYSVRGGVERFDNQGNLVNATFISDPNFFASSCVVDNAQHIWVGGHGFFNLSAPGLLEYDESGNLLASYAPALEVGGVDYLALASDQCTFYYTSSNDDVKRFDVCTNTQLPDFATGLNGTCDGLQVLSTGLVLVSCTSQVYALFPDGSIGRTYPESAYGGSGGFVSLALPPDEISFWVDDLAGIYRINGATGSLMSFFPFQSIGGGGFNDIGALAVFAGGSPPVHPIIFVHGLGANSNKIGAPQPFPSDNEFVPLYAELGSVYGLGNITTFAYVDDRSIKDNAPKQQCPAGLYPPCQSQSSVDANALSLSGVVKELYTETNHKVALIGYSMGGSIMRTLLAGCPDAQGTPNCPDAPGMVDSAFFLGSVQQGSWILRVKQGADAAGLIPILGKEVNLLARGIYRLFQAVTGFNPKYPAYTDLTPQSTNIKAHNAFLPPSNINYFNFYSDIQVQFSIEILPYWIVPIGRPVPFGDLILLRGDDNPQATPYWGGARFCLGCGNQDQYTQNQNYREWPLVRVVPYTISEFVGIDLLASLVTLSELHTNLFKDSALNGGIQVQDSTGQGGTTSISHEILLQLEREDGLL